MGHLQHHLNKLNGLIKTDDYGKYCLSIEGKDALLTVQTVENTSPKKEKGHRRFKIGLKPVAFLLTVLLIASSAIAVYEYNQAAENHAALLREKVSNADEFAGAYLESNILHLIFTNNATATKLNFYRDMMRYYDGVVFETAEFPLSRLYAVQDALTGVMKEFGIEATAINEISNRVDINLLDRSNQQAIVEFLKSVFNDFDDGCVEFMGPAGLQLTTNPNSSFNPPVSMNTAIQLTLELYGYNETSVIGKSIDARLEMWQTTTNGTLISQSSLTSIPSDYSPVTENGIIYRYVWVITIRDTTIGWFTSRANRRINGEFCDYPLS